MDYSIKVNEVRSEKETNIRGYATVVFGGAFKLDNVAILENKQTQQLFVAMPRYRTNERDTYNNAIYKDVCHPITAEFREKLYGDILNAYQQQVKERKSEPVKDSNIKEPEFSVRVMPYEREGSKIKGLASICLEDSFVINNVNIYQGKEADVFVTMPSSRTNKVDGKGDPIYKDVCYPVTKEFREKLYGEIVSTYNREREQKQERTGKEPEKGAAKEAAAKSKPAIDFKKKSSAKIR